MDCPPELPTGRGVRPEAWSATSMARGAIGSTADAGHGSADAHSTDGTCPAQPAARVAAHRHARHRARHGSARHPDHEHAGLRHVVLHRGRRLALVDEPDRPDRRAAARHVLLRQVQQHVQPVVRPGVHVAVRTHAAGRSAAREHHLPAPPAGAGRPRLTAREPVLDWRCAAHLRRAWPADAVRAAPRERPRADRADGVVPALPGAVGACCACCSRRPK